MSSPFRQGPAGGPLPTYTSNAGPGSNMARRSSYASVVSGTANTGPSSQQPARSGFFLHMPGQSPTSATSHHGHASPTSHHHSRSAEIPHSHGSNLPDYWERSQLPQYPFSNVADHFGGVMVDSRNADFFVPSYLQGSKHVERLEERYKTRLATQRDGRSTRSSNAGSLSTSASSMNLHKMVPSHRGMTHDIIERPFTHHEDVLAPLPSRWSTTDKFSGLEIHNDGTEVKFTGLSKANDEAATVRADHPMPRECGIYYFEITVLGRGKEGLIGVGFSGPKVPLNRLPGWEQDSWAYHGDDGFSFCQTASGKNYGPRFSASDVIGCGVNFRTGCAFFTKNGVNLGTAFKEIKAPVLYPSVGMKKPGEHLRANFGQSPFVYDIDSMFAREKEALQEEIASEETAKLADPRSEVDLLRDLVAQYLAHDGYIETAKAFAEEVRAMSTLLRPSSASKELNYKEDQDAINRQRIRTAILEGNVDKALKYTSTFYPTVLTDNENIYFKLRCRKFIEMIRQYTEYQPPLTRKKSGSVKTHSTSNGHGRHASLNDEEYYIDQHMELDDERNGTLQEEVREQDGHDPSNGAMDVEYGDSVYSRQANLMNEALLYGQELQLEFKDDPRREVKQALEDTFALIAYPDARESSLAPLLEVEGRTPVAEELNCAILVSLGRSSSAAIERLIQQAEVLVGDLSQEGGAASLINVRNDYLR